MTRWKTICSDPKVFQIIHNNPITPIMIGCGYKYYEEITIKSKHNETLQKKPIETTKSHHDFHHTEYSMKLRLQPSKFPFAMNNRKNHSREIPRVYTVASLKKNTEQYITEPTFIS
jgi:hypothetical protein